MLRATLDSQLAEDHSADLGQIEAPTLILFGDRDVVFTLADQQRLDAEIADSQLIVYPQTGHRPQTERAVEVGRDVASFLRSN